MFGKILNYHRFMLGDHLRVKAYREAIHRAVKPGDIVVDIGTGSGLLSFLAVQAGARKVYSIEQDEIIEEARRLAKINGMEDKITFIRGLSDKIELPEKTDVMISEILGHFGIDENVVKFIADGRKRFLKDGGKMVPLWLDLYIVPVETPEIWDNYIGLWNGDFYGLDFSPVKKEALMQQYVLDCYNKVKFISEPGRLYHFDLEEHEKSMDFTVEFNVSGDGDFHGFVGSFTSGLFQDIVISSSPEYMATNWKQTFLPLENKVSLRKDDKISVNMKAVPRGTDIFWEWETVVFRDGNEIGRYSQKDTMVTREDILNKITDYKPVLNEHGAFLKRVFQLADGKKSITEMSDLIYSEYPDKYGHIDSVKEDISNILGHCMNLNLLNLKK